MREADSEFMAAALEEAKLAAKAGEVPIGAVAVRAGQLIARARNRVEERHSVTAHAELELLHAVELLLDDWRMEEITFFVTKEPCPMCAGALANARVKRIVYGLPDPRCGGCGGGLDITGFPGQLWHPEVQGGVLAEEAGKIMRNFFRGSREKKNSARPPIHFQNFQSRSYTQRCNALMREVFGGTLEHWYRLGAWNRQFECYAKLDGPRMLAQIGLFRLNLSIQGAVYPVIELNGVAVAPDARNRGYARELLEHILDRYGSTPAILFANDSVLDFYPKFGFRPHPDLLPVLEETVDNPEEPRRLSPDAARPLLERHTLLSQSVDSADALPIRLYHLYGDFADHLYPIGENIAIAAKQSGTTLHLFDLFGTGEIGWDELRRALPFRNVTRIEFGFSPDRLGVACRWIERHPKRNLFLRGDLPLPVPGTIPLALES